MQTYRFAPVFIQYVESNNNKTPAWVKLDILFLYKTASVSMIHPCGSPLIVVFISLRINNAKVEDKCSKINA